MLKEKLMNDLKEAMKEKNEIKKNTVQMVRAAILQIEKDKGITVEDEKIIEIIAKEIYGADGVTYDAAADKEIERLEKLGYGNLPVCMAKNQYSLSDDAAKLGRPSGFNVNIREVYVSAGAGFVVAITGTVMTMPGLPLHPAAERIDVDDNGVITGLS